MRNMILAFVAAAVLTPSLVLANPGTYQGPVEITALKDLQGFTLSDQDVVVEGHIVRQINHDTFMFSDGTGEMMIELDDDIRLPAEGLNENVRVRLFGEYDAGMDKEIEVEQLQVLSTNS
ncbi:NirD/YgiW/YdeI family stress tolerance protein [Parendozoicomonas haliclonae]|uniref:Bacterial OB fold (BOF) protein n=1 Tax=Parendozoicomonas haliclonae TaxID=1960125 RepID=A0A1X7AEQ7_9GAMM|nr:NirD/YgiW/YdeI family stress tolerance protein [Parendozoicomonas haliclonae]SMA35167.1 Bacterial OB fold (BOF) protein [Parendozoicomonas haliclonae]